MTLVDATRYVFMHSLFDERKCAQRFSFELESAFETVGKRLERPDYYGTGEADGDFSEVNMESLRKDVKSFCSYGDCFLIGIRFGASLIIDYLKSCPNNVIGAILIEPVYCMNEYVSYLHQKQRIKDIMTGYNEVEKERGEYYNIEGYKTQKCFLEQLTNYGTIGLRACSKVPLSVISNEGNIQNSIDAKHLIVSYEPFWERIPPQEYRQIIDTIVEEIGVI